MGVYSKLNRPIHVVDYDPNWPMRYETEKTLILATLGANRFQIEHFGSTSVPGLEAKPVIDIAIGVERLEQALALIPPLETLGYIYEPSYEVAVPERRFLWKGTQLVHAYHISIEEISGKSWVEHLIFRDFLRAHPEAARRYQKLKQELAARCVSDMEAYVSGKTDFVLSCLSKAKDES